VTDRIDPRTARQFAQVALGHVTREYPYKLDHVLEGDQDALPPRKLHPIFFGSFDWHSCVHGWWTLLTLRRLYPGTDEAAAIETLAMESFTPAKVAAELAYLDRPSSRGFERPYGSAWLLYLHLEASRWGESDIGRTVEPLAAAFAERLKSYFSVLTYPLRVGTHFNTPFALILALEWAERFDQSLVGLIRERAFSWFSGDRQCQAWEPGGDEFLSPALTEAHLMSRLLDRAGFATWFEDFLPDLARGSPETLFVPAIVSDRSDGKIAHLDGLNLSRAWSWRSIASRLDDERVEVAEDSARRHLEASLPHVAGDYAGEHWLASFALLALLARK
jgi:hypothetical protein